MGDNAKIVDHIQQLYRRYMEVSSNHGPVFHDILESSRKVISSSELISQRASLQEHIKKMQSYAREILEWDVEDLATVNSNNFAINDPLEATLKELNKTRLEMGASIYVAVEECNALSDKLESYIRIRATQQGHQSAAPRPR